MGSADLVARRERSLLTPAVRGDRAQLEALLHPEFEEVGASGRRWTRAQIIDDLVAAPSLDGLEISELTSRALSADVVLVTYTSRRGGVTARRSSMWVRSDHGWVVRFHQGTPANRGRRRSPRSPPSIA